MEHPKWSEAERLEFRRNLERNLDPRPTMMMGVPKLTAMKAREMRDEARLNALEEYDAAIALGSITLEEAPEFFQQAYADDLQSQITEYEENHVEGDEE